MRDEFNLSTVTTLNSEFTVYAPAASNAYYDAIDLGYNTEISSAVSYSGICGDDVRWTLDITKDMVGTLTISGFGDMYDWDSAYVQGNDENECPEYAKYAQYIKSVTIEEGIRGIGRHAFSDFVNLSSLSLPDSLTRIAGSAFSGCSSLDSITIPRSVNSICELAFEGCTSLASVNITEACSYIGYEAFSQCVNLTSFTLPEMLYEFNIGSLSYSGVKTLTVLGENTHLRDEFNLSTVTTLNSEFTVYAPAASNAYYDAIDLGYNTEISSAASYSGICGDDVRWTLDITKDMVGTLTISGSGDMNNWSRIYDGSGYDEYGNFRYDCNSGYPEYARFKDYIKNVVIDCDITSISNYAFAGFDKLETVTFSGEYPHLSRIGEYAFMYCSSLQEITFDNIIYIEPYAFESCTSLNTVNLTGNFSGEIKEMAFSNCTALTSLTIPELFYDFDITALSGCSSFISLTIAGIETQIVCGNTFGQNNLNPGLTIYTPVTSCAYDYAIENSINVIVTTGVSYSGMCGDNATWELDITKDIVGTLTISGFGEMNNWNETYNGFDYSEYTEFKDYINIVVIGDKISYVCSRAFDGFDKLETVIFSESSSVWLTISDNAFRNCISLRELTFPTNIYGIHNSAFSGCSSLSDISFPKSEVWNPIIIDENAFYACTSLTEITITDIVGSIYANAFADCTSLRKVTIQEGPWRIDENAFSGCTSLKEIILPNTLEFIESYAFQSCTALEKINITKNITNFGNSIFNGCSSLASLDLPEELRSFNLSALGGIASQIALNVPGIDTELTIEESQSLDKTKLTIYTPSGSAAHRFALENDLNVIVTSSDPTGICGDGLTWSLSLNGDSEGTLTISGVGNMTNYSSASPAPWNEYKGEIKSVIVSDGVNTIGSSAFSGCTALISADLPDTLVSIGNYAFYKCSSLESIVIPDGVRSINIYTFSGCTKLSSVTLGSGVKKIDRYAFHSCRALGELTIPAEVATIGQYAFLGCTSLKFNTYYGSYALAYAQRNSIAYSAQCAEHILGEWITDTEPTFTESGSRHKECTVCGEIIERGIIERLKTPEEIYTFTISGNEACITGSRETLSGIIELPSVLGGYAVTSIASAAFKGQTGITGIIVPDGVNTIGSSAFSGCTALISADLPDTLVSIGNYAFYKCSSLESIVIPDGVRSINIYTFSGCTKLSSVTLGSGVKKIDRYAFHNCKALGELTIPAEVATIGQYAFLGCATLKFNTYYGSYALAYAQRNSIAYSAQCAEHIPGEWITDTESTFTEAGSRHKECSVCGEVIERGIIERLKTPEEIYTFTISGNEACITGSRETLSGIIELPSALGGYAVTSIASAAFKGQTGITGIIVPDGVNTIGSSAFSGCTALISADLPDTLVSIGNYAFYKCSSLESIVIPDGVRSINIYTFSGCTKLSSVTLGSGVKKIDRYAFHSCRALGELTIAANVTTIGQYAFLGCKNLTIYAQPETAAYTYAIANNVIIG